MNYNVFSISVILLMCGSMFSANGQQRSSPNPLSENHTSPAMARGNTITGQPEILNQTDIYSLVPSSDKGLVALFNFGESQFLRLQLLAPHGLNNLSMTVTSDEARLADLNGDVILVSCNSITSEELMLNSTSLEVLPEYGLVNKSQNNQLNGSSCYNVAVPVVGSWLGYTKFHFSLHFMSSSGGLKTVYLGSHVVKIMRFYRVVDKMFRVTIYTMVAFATLGMGCDMDLAVIKEHLKTPKAPLIALFSQFTFMPLLSYSIIHVMQYNGGEALGLFVMGISPGGGASNMYSKLLGGDMSVSVTMTTLSTFASLGMIPLWLYTLGKTLPANEIVGEIKVPFLSILRSLALVIGPLLIGVLIKYKLPKVAKGIKKGLKFFFLIIIIFLFTVGIYSNLYIYQSFNPSIVFSSAVLPYGGYLCGGLLAWIIRLEWKLIKTVALETGMQNVGLAVLIIQTSLPNPASDLALVPAIVAVIMTSMPWYAVLPVIIIRRKLKQRRDAKNKDNSSIDEEEKLSAHPNEREMRVINGTEEQDEKKDFLSSA